MKIAYITVQDSTNIRSFSGTGYYVPKSFEKQGAKVHYIGKLKTKPYLIQKFKEYYYKYILGKKYWYNRDPKVLKNYARQIQRELSKIDADVLVSISGIPLTMLKTDIPIVIWVDAVFPDIIDFYPEFTNMAKETIRNGYKMEWVSLDRCSHVVFSSDWAAQSAAKHYNLPSEKISVIPYGANIETSWGKNTVEGLIQSKSSKKCTLLFVGVDWIRKGGDAAVETVKILNENGLPAELHVLGCSPPKQNKTFPDYIHFHGFISKETSEGKKQFHDLISAAHFLILPTKADCTPIVFAEFNSYGIPCLTNDVGGITTLIKANINGQTFDLNSSPAEYAHYIKNLFKDYEKYKKMAYRSYEEYANRLNWGKSGEKMMQVLQEKTENNLYDKQSSHSNTGT
jgi:glycosyltransferase involved in cell wall biosynthesis